MANLIFTPLLTTLLSISGALPAPVVDISDVDVSDVKVSNVHLAKKEEKPPAALVTEVEVLKEYFANTWFYTLRGQLKNQSDATLLTPLVYFEIYSEDKLVEAGTVEITPKGLPAGQVGSFQQELNSAGRVKITLVQWQQPDKTVKSHKQMQFFPLESPTRPSDN